MNPKRIAFSFLVVLLALPAVAGTSELLSIVPADAVSVGVVSIDDLKSGQFGSLLFEHNSDITTDGEAMMFLQEAGLDPMSDVSAILFAVLPREGNPEEGEVLLLVEGNFNPSRLAAAITRRGAVPESSAGGVAYFRLDVDDEGEEPRRTPVVSFASTTLTIAGTEGAVVKALEQRAAGDSRFLVASNIGRDLAKIDRNASSWAMMDVQRSARMGRSMIDDLDDEQARSFGKALRYVSTMGVWASERNGNIEFGGVALTADGETRVLLEDVVRGITAAWRMAAREENPEWLPVIRSFEINRDDAGVRINGSIPIALLKDHREQVASR